MIKFFRRIRQKLLNEGKLKRYFIYAIGEILLVMIGILLALQINNWNTNEMNRQLEEKILKQVHADFQQNKIRFEKVTSRRLRNLENCNKIIEMFPIDLKEVNLDNLSLYLKNISNRSTFNPANGAINTLVSSASFDIISNEQLRALLIQWKDLVADYLEDEAIADYHLVNFWDPYMDKKLLQRLHDHPKIETIYDTRVNLNFLSTIEFENLVIRRKLNLQRIVSPGDEITELEMMKGTIDKIIGLSTTH